MIASETQVRARPASTVNLVYRPHVNQRKTIADAARKLPGTG